MFFVSSVALCLLCESREFSFWCGVAECVFHVSLCEEVRWIFHVYISFWGWNCLHRISLVWGRKSHPRYMFVIGTEMSFFLLISGRFCFLHYCQRSGLLLEDYATWNCLQWSCRVLVGKFLSYEILRDILAAGQVFCFRIGVPVVCVLFERHEIALTLIVGAFFTWKCFCRGSSDEGRDPRTCAYVFRSSLHYFFSCSISVSCLSPGSNRIFRISKDSCARCALHLKLDSIFFRWFFQFFFSPFYVFNRFFAYTEWERVNSLCRIVQVCASLHRRLLPFLSSVEQNLCLFVSITFIA